MTPPTCSCGAVFKREGQQRSRCQPCIEKDALRRSQAPESTAPEQPVTALRLYRAAQAESGWPKGIVTVGGVLTLCSEGAINGHAHRGTLVGVLNERGTIEDVQAMVSA